MRILLSFLVLTIQFFWSCNTGPNLNQEIISHEGEPILVGEVDLEGFSNEPYSDWFDKNYMDYQVDMAVLQGITIENIEIKLFLGTWCSDSQLQVPQFYKILTRLDFDRNKLQMIGLDNHPERDLQSPQHEEKGLNIEFVPTFIFYRDGKEIGRIIEFPEESLEKDMVKIVGVGA